MGEVYEARDTRLGRTVAVKVLPESVSQDALARQRFEREARAVAALSHPHICPLFDIGRDGDRDYLVMEFLEGETLAASLHHGRIPLHQALTLGSQIGSALVAAHRAGIVHRDLKPGNVMLTESGARLLDFGLARSAIGLTPDTKTLTAAEPLTGTGVILGTLPYMAPEQLEGRATDTRTDVFAFGVVLYEMVTGRRAFNATSQAALVGSILRDDPPAVTALDPVLPAALDHLIRRCLAKEPSERWQTIAEAQAQLDVLRDSVRPSSGITNPGFKRRRTAKAAVGMMATVAVITAFVMFVKRKSPEPSSGDNPFAHLQIQPLTLTGDIYSGAISPDGRFVAYVRRGDGLWVRQVQADNGVRIVRLADDVMYDNVTFTPDGNSIDYVVAQGAAHDLWRVPLLGGTPRPVIKGVWSSPGWSQDGQHFAFVREETLSDDVLRSSLVVADADGRHERVVATRRSFGFISGEDRPHWSPDGRHIVLAALIPPPKDGTVLHTSALLTIDVSTGALVGTRMVQGHALLYSAGWQDEAHAIVNGHEMGPFRPGLSAMDVSNGRVYPITREFASFFGITLDKAGNAGVTVSRRILAGVWTCNAGGEQVRQVVPETLEAPEGPVMDRAGSLVYAASRGDDARVLYRLPAGAQQPVALVEDSSYIHATTPDGQYILFSGGPMGALHRVNSDGTNLRTLVERDAGGPLVTPDGRTVLFSREKAVGIYSVPVAGGPVREVARRAVSIWRSISPDGRRLLQGTQTPGVVLECELPDCTNLRERALKSAQWAPSGKGVAFVQADRLNLWEQPLDGGPPGQLTHFTDGRQIFSFSWSPDYKQLVLARGTVSDDLILLKGLR
jgi:serine/threonine protein kinase/Tol biopolymer transport system component